jgi:Zn finger protein HypA/HybF involved in hydrogenase expression
MKTTYLIELAVDEKWFEAISNFTADVYEDELCEWVRVQAETETDENDCENCEENPKEDLDGTYCEPCRREFKDTDDDLTNDDDNEIIKETHLEEK